MTAEHSPFENVRTSAALEGDDTDVGEAEIQDVAFLVLKQNVRQ